MNPISLPASALRLAVAMALALLALAAASAPARAEFGIASFDGSVHNADNTPYTQAGGHPYAADTVLEFNTLPDPQGFPAPIPDGTVKEIVVDLPAGFAGNPASLPECPAGVVATDPELCPVDSQVGLAVASTQFFQLIGGRERAFALYNVTPDDDTVARFGYNVTGTPVIFDVEIRSGSDYGLVAVFDDVSQALRTLGGGVRLWGVPADPSHNAQRGCSPGEASDFSQPGFEQVCGAPTPAGLPPTAFFTNPTRCTPPGVGLEFKARASSHEQPGVFDTASFTSHLPAPEETTEVGITGCEIVPFEPSISVEPTSQVAGAPTGLDVELRLPQQGLVNPNGIATSHLKGATVELPEGMTVNPSAADGLGSCAPDQIALDSPAPAQCPESAKIGSVRIETPLLEKPLEGAIYQAKQSDNPFGSLLAIYAVAEGPGVVIKLPGRVETDAEGDMTTSFEDNPQMPFSKFSLHFKGGPRAVLRNPSSCGTHTATAGLTPWARPGEVVSRSSSFEITSCPRSGFDPHLDAGTANPVAGAFSPFVLRLSREDGTAELGGLRATLPEGLLAKLAGVPICPDSALAAVSAAAGTGAAQEAAPSCPAASQVGRVTVGAGAGPSPFFTHSGRAYLAGPYKGAMHSLAVVTPAVAGPFDLGSVLTRNVLRVDPQTTQVTAVSDPLPSVLHGIRLDLRDVRVEIDRPQFMLNPTSCEKMAIEADLTSVGGETAKRSERFQVGDCAALGFKPKLSLKFSGATHRSAHPALKAVLKMPKQGANIGKAVVSLPKTEFLENAHIRTVCTRVQYAAGNCPAGSVYGYAKAWSPLLDKPLQGPVYLRSSSHTLPDLVASLDGEIHVDLPGRIDSPGGKIRNTFWAVPDAPVSKFVLTMQGGKKGLLVNNTELCKAKPRARAEFTGQNGKLSVSNPLVKVDCGKSRGKR